MLIIHNTGNNKAGLAVAVSVALQLVILLNEAQAQS